MGVKTKNEKKKPTKLVRFFSRPVLVLAAIVFALSPALSVMLPQLAAAANAPPGTCRSTTYIGSASDGPAITGLCTDLGYNDGDQIGSTTLDLSSKCYAITLRVGNASSNSASVISCAGLTINYFKGGTLSVSDADQGAFIADAPGKIIQNNHYYWSLVACSATIDMDVMTGDELSSWRWFYRGHDGDNIYSDPFFKSDFNIKALDKVGTNAQLIHEKGAASDTSKYIDTYLGDMYGDGKACFDGAYMKTAFGALGITNPVSAFCSMKIAYNKTTSGPGKGKSQQACISGNGQGDFDANGGRSDQINAFKKLLTSTAQGKVAAAGVPNYAKYIESYSTFMKGCGKITLADAWTSKQKQSDTLRKLTVVGTDGSTLAIQAKTESGSRPSRDLFGGDDPDVPAYWADLRGSDKAYGSSDSAWANYNVFVSCDDLAKQTGSYAQDYAIWLRSNPNATGNTQGSNPADDSADQTSCAVEGIGWIICPVMNFMAKLNDAAFGFISQFLTIEPALLTDKTTLAAWQKFRDLANAAFVIAFLIILYSQMTGAGVSNYGLKKLLPKLIIAAILVNVSYYVCEIAVDLSNIVGSTINTFFNNITVGSQVGKSAWVDTTGTILKTAIVGAAIVALIALVIFAPIVLLAFALIILILIGRKALLLLLVVVSPLAFVAYLLPNTEQWFKKWWKMFSTLLLLFPIIGAVFGASKMAATIVQAAGAKEDSTLMQIVALGILAIPLFAVPVLLKGALAAAGSVGAKISGLQDKANSRAKQGLKDSRLGEAKTAFDARRQSRQVSRRLGKGRIASVGQAMQRRGWAGGGTLETLGSLGSRLDQTRAGQYFGGGRGRAAATSAYNKALFEETERQMSTMGDMNADQLLAVGMDTSQSAERRAAAFRKLETVGGHQHIQKAFDYLDEAGAKGVAGIDDVQQLAADSLLKRKPAGVKTSEANRLREGTLGMKTETVTNPDGSTSTATRQKTDAETGYYNMFASRVKEGAFGAGDYAKMDKDDLIRLAEMSRDGKVDGAGLQAQFDAISADETLKGTMTDERKALFDSIVAGSGPLKVDGSEHKLTSLHT